MSTQFAYKAGDAALAVLETRTIHPIVVLDTQGRAYTIRASEVPGGRGDGVPVTTLIELQPGAKVAQAIVGRARAEISSSRAPAATASSRRCRTWCRA